MENGHIWWKLILILMLFELQQAHSRITVSNLQMAPSKGRVKRAWTYPEIRIQEGPNEFPIRIAEIKSDDPRAVTYRLRGDGVGTDKNDPNVKFIIAEDTGLINQIHEVDREEKDKYEVVATALDSNGKKVESDVTIPIVVLDNNDNKPEFVRSSLVGAVEESNDGSSPFMKLQATDKDINMNGVLGIKYSIVPRPLDLEPRFSVAANGKVSVIGKLDFEKDPTVYFVVKAEDGGRSPGIAATATVTVTVLDSNDHAPVIENTPPKSVSELFPVNMTLYYVTATDVDKEKNKEVYFKIVNGNTGGTFAITSYPSNAGKSKGEIKLVKPLDFEDGETEFTLRVQAYNKLAANADASAFQSSTDVVIKVTDGNEPPEFKNTPYNTVVSEAKQPPFNLDLPISTKDRDFGSNQTVFYSIAMDPESWFTIDNSTGTITAVSKLDREAPSVVKNIYTLIISATDNYPGNPASANGEVSISIEDVNDNPPLPVLTESNLNIIICEKPENQTIFELEAADADDNKKNGPPFKYRFAPAVPKDKWRLVSISPTSAIVKTYVKDFNVQEKHEILLPFYISDRGSPQQTGTSTLTVSVCPCSDGEPICTGSGGVIHAGVPLPVIIAIIILLLLVIVVVLAAIAYKRRRDAQFLKQPFFEDEDDVRETLQVYQEEGGEEDHEAYDLSALRTPLMDKAHAPVCVERPLQQAPQTRMPRGAVPDDIGDYIGDAKDQADNDPSAPPFDSLLVFDYEGNDSDCGSLSSINSATTDGSMDYDHLDDWGPRFKRLADMYNDGSDTD